ncbi:MAG: type I 3-dehydroquinate dehydratase [Synergistaceae bacterium]|nr:type I 3-dehydroquinate dehydratase [Synergistaceae bacterium]MBQ4402111.1 type I 3-dehydroquinate dehydratase [Synergistaceae bacterium]MBQ6665781.1 type I 3-dehydroquinate dehydratase [Synergistaceae bacterium]MBQ6983246.1 type I 3-dehydroquinate dehydratase [Synergistaceae bacterium]MBR0249416.1 type I 3-dehydroquinate dehydratase [Synergistaceae bacterium]
MKTLNVRGVELGAGVPKTIVPIVAKTKADILAKAKEITQLPADLVEWRADFYEDLFHTPKLLETLKELRGVLGNTPILFTIRTKPEGGEVKPTFSDYQAANKAVAQSGDADLVDVEMFWGITDWNAPASNYSAKLVEEIHKAGCLVVGSRHNFSATPSKGEIVTTLKNQKAAGADMPKAAVMPKSKEDVIAVIAASVEFGNDADRPFLTISMGPLGMMSRVACELSGSCMTFGAAGQVSAPGQIQVGELKDMLTKIHNAQAGA